MEQLLFSLNATVPVFLVMVIGYLLKIFRIVDAPFIKTLNSFNFKITLPVLLFMDIAESDFYSVWDTKYVLYCFCVTLLCICVIWLMAGFFYRNGAQRGELIQASYRSSAAVLGIAFIQNIYGNSGMAPLMIIGTVPLYNVAAVLILSLTGPLMTQSPTGQTKSKIPANSWETAAPDAQDAEAGCTLSRTHRLDRAALKKSLKGVATNPIIWGILLGILASLLRISFPVMISKTLNNIAKLASPLALIGLGAGFEGRKALKQLKPTAVISVIKLVLLPAIFLPLALSLGFTNEKLVAILVMLGSPTTPSCYIMAKNMGHEGTLTSSVVLTTTFLSSITLTAWVFLLRYLGVI